MDPSRPAAKPKIRVVHILAPEVIETNPANFRELVQRLTGRPAKRCHGGGVDSKKKKMVAGKIDEEGRACMERNSCELFGGFGDVEGFFQELSDIPLLPLLSLSHMDVI